MIWRYNDRFGYPAWCDIDIHQRADGKQVFLVTEIVHNPGRCITNNPVKLANEIKDHYRLKPNEMIWIEHYPERPGCGTSNEWLSECYDLVRLSAHRRCEFTAAESKRITMREVDDLMSGRLEVADVFSATAPDSNALKVVA
jgi:hypothetical protein